MSVGSANDLLWRLVKRRETRAIITLHDAVGETTFYCLHPIGGGIGNFLPLARLIGGKQRICGIQVPAEKMTAEFGSSVYEIARYYVDLIIAFQPTGRIVLGGWSIGATIALEMARQLSSIGREVPLLIAFDGAPPTDTKVGLSPWNPKYIWKLLRNFPAWAIDARSDKAARKMFQSITEKVTFHLVIRGHFHAPLVRDLLVRDGWTADQTAFVRALYTAGQRYRCASYQGQVILYETTTQPLWRLPQLAAIWKSIAEHLEIVTVNGSHRSIFQEPAITLIADDLGRRLNRI